MSEYYKTNKNFIPGTSYGEVEKSARRIFNSVANRTKRRPYLRSEYFRKEKVFITIYWKHLFEKHPGERTRRMKIIDCGFDLVRNSRINPVTRENFKVKEEILHRFYGVTKNGDKFIVQIKENKRSKRKDLISIYPE